MSRPVPELLAHGQALIAAGLPEAVETLLQPELGKGTGPILLWKLLALAFRRQGKFAAARRVQEMIVETLPGDLPARYDFADTLLTLGEFERGWQEYQYRYHLPHTKAIARHIQRPRWTGVPIPGRTLLIHDEQGYGDTFQFVRLIRAARERSQAQVILEVNSEAFPLVQRSYPDFPVTKRGTLPPPFDHHCELMSLPAALGLRLEDLPGEIPYLLPDPARIAHWQNRLRALPRPWIALTWAGRPAHPNDANRSTRLDTFAPLAPCRATFLSIQKGPAENQPAPPGMSLTRLSPEIRDFEDTAAILMLTDLLISIDSSPVHLAGALGRPAWVLLPFEPEWRWMAERQDTPWYPAHRLFRQRRPGDWAELLERVARALETDVPAYSEPLKTNVF
ncbi:MAG: glycosyl transferase family 8 [Acidithiobacillus sp.]|uniref:glycosyl transferase family 8 n=1 Tax=Acidithiobacillus sp. TaxID=1872118 RepID=UPI003D08423D